MITYGNLTSHSILWEKLSHISSFTKHECKSQRTRFIIFKMTSTSTQTGRTYFSDIFYTPKITNLGFLNKHRSPAHPNCIISVSPFYALHLCVFSLFLYCIQKNVMSQRFSRDVGFKNPRPILLCQCSNAMLSSNCSVDIFNIEGKKDVRMIHRYLLEWIAYDQLLICFHLPIKICGMIQQDILILMFLPI